MFFFFSARIVTESFLRRCFIHRSFRRHSTAFPVNESRRRSIDCDKRDLPPSRRQPSYGSMIFREKDENYEIAVSSFASFPFESYCFASGVYKRASRRWMQMDGWIGFNDRSDSLVRGDKTPFISYFITTKKSCRTEQRPRYSNYSSRYWRRILINSRNTYSHRGENKG